MAGRSLREQNKQRNFAHIKQVAKRLFAEKGYEETTTREIAEAAEIATGTLFLYARDKAELLLFVYSDMLAEITADTFDTLPSDLPLIEELVYVMRPFFLLYGQHRTNARHFLKEFLFFSENGGDRRPFGSLQDDFYARLTHLVQRAQERGEIRDDLDPRLAARGFYAMYIAAVTAWLGDVLLEDGDVLTQLRAIFDLQIRGMLP